MAAADDLSVAHGSAAMSPDGLGEGMKLDHGPHVRSNDRKELPMLRHLNLRQLGPRTGIYRVHPRLAGSLA